MISQEWKPLYRKGWKNDQVSFQTDRFAKSEGKYTFKKCKNLLAEK